MRRLLLLCGFGTLVLGCGGKDADKGSSPEGAPLDCAWLASDNCWKTTVAAAASCVPPESTVGELNADGTACTYASGTNIEFEAPVMLPIDATKPPSEWHFDETTAGQPCVSYDERDNYGETLTVQGMTYSDKAIGLGLQVTCPDGSQYAAPNALELFACNDAFTDSPAHYAPASDSSVSFQLARGNLQTLTIFDCAR